MERLSLDPLSDLTTLRLGGPPARMVEAHAEGELAELVRSAYEPLLVLAGGSNVVVADSGFPGTVVRVLTRGVKRDGERLEVQAGESWDELVADCVARGLQGFECLSGIPGSTGATPIQNVGAYGQEVAETVESVRVLDRASGQIVELSAEQCGFRYRGSIFKYRDRHVVLAGGSNVVVADGGFPGTVVRVLTRGVRRDGERLEVQAGEPWDELVAMTVAQGLQGFECLSGIPGSTGATPIQNVGAYGQEVAETVESVRVLDRASGQIVELPAVECGFTYRSSIFK